MFIQKKILETSEVLASSLTDAVVEGGGTGDIPVALSQPLSTPLRCYVFSLSKESLILRFSESGRAPWHLV